MQADEQNIDVSVNPVIALVQGQPVTQLPRDLYIPPEALEIFLETFQGPLDLLLYLIKKQNLDVLDIPIAEITRQYMEYVEIMKDIQLELAAEYLVMAALLAEIKSRMLLPRPVDVTQDEADPRAELVRRLQEYERIKIAAENLDKLPQLGQDFFLASAQIVDVPTVRPLPIIELKELLQAFVAVMHRVSLHAKHAIQRDSLSVRERMSEVLTKIQTDRYIAFDKLFNLDEGKLGVVVTFIAVLELIKQALVEIVQQEPFSPIHVKAVSE